MTAPDKDVQFAGSIPAMYAKHLVPVLFAPYAEDLAKRIAATIRKGDLLEIACGTGVLTRRLDATLPRDVRITASDLNEGMLACAQAEAGPSSRVQWRPADAMALPFPDRTFDAIVSQFGLMFVPDKVAAFREARRVLREGGSLTFSVWDRIEENRFAAVCHPTIASFFPGTEPSFYRLPFSYHDPKAIASDLAAAGFRDVKIETIAMLLTAASAADLARGAVEGNPIAHAIRDAGLAIEPIVEAVAKAFQDSGGDRPYRSPSRALVVSARVGVPPTS